MTAEAGTPPPLLGGGTQDGKRILPGPEDPLSTKGKNYISKYFAPGLVNGFLLILFFASVVAIIVAGVMYILSSGDQELTKKAKDVIFWAIVGALIAAMAYAMVRFVVNIDLTKHPSHDTRSNVVNTGNKIRILQDGEIVIHRKYDKIPCGQPMYVSKKGKITWRKQHGRFEKLVTPKWLKEMAEHIGWASSKQDKDGSLKVRIKIND